MSLGPNNKEVINIHVDSSVKGLMGKDKTTGESISQKALRKQKRN